jgi:hypothetical protein
MTTARALPMLVLPASSTGIRLRLKLKKTKTPLSEASGCLAASALITPCTSSPGLR